MDYRELNMSINRLYRQLGKEVYEQVVSGVKDEKKTEKLIKKIGQNIDKIENMKSEEELQNIILPPKANEGDMPLYIFCKSCRVGNHPDSTHCIRCGVSLK